MFDWALHEKKDASWENNKQEPMSYSIKKYASLDVAVANDISIAKRYNPFLHLHVVMVVCRYEEKELS
jgi:hypothetical protein